MTYKPTSSSLTNQFWSQATWFIDPANSTGLASDNNTGLDATHPVLSYNGGVVAKWGTTSPTLNQDTTLTWLSSQPITGSFDPVIFTPVVGATAVSTAGAQILIQGLISGSNQIAAGVLTGVIPKNRTTPQQLTVNLGVSVPLGSVVYNTTSGKESYATVYSLVSGTTYIVTQPLTVPVLPLTQFSGGRTEVDTWANGDSFVVYALTEIEIVNVNGFAVVELNEPDAFPPQIQIVNVRVQSPDGSSNSNGILGTSIATVNTVWDRGMQLDGRATDVANIFSGTTAFAGVYDGTQSPGAGQAPQLWEGGAIASPFGGASFRGNIISDAYLDATSGLMTIGSSDAPLADIGAVWLGGIVIVATGSSIDCTTAIFWGNGSLYVSGVSRVLYGAAPGAAVATFLNAVAPATGSLLLNGLSTATSIRTTGVWIPFAALTPANLDNAAVFGGLAINPGGGSISNQGST